MASTEKIIKQMDKKNPGFADEIMLEKINLEVAIKTRDIRDSFGLSQWEFGKLLNKPQSTIARIENGNMNASIKLLAELSQKTQKRFTIQFNPVY